MSVPDEVPVSITEQRLRDAFAAAGTCSVPGRWEPCGAERTFGATMFSAVATSAAAAAAASGMSTCS